ncbi:MAG: alanine--glyoxylate aminotransferase family protein [Anaerolineae bacterium]|nr:alanine--glyoxylate aminotransferase family protein [Anaerolineae bacterium]MDQ7034051.1 alanine--glyoxylate aminotransferase family protein [Anaerolineae bacterium]
MSNFDHQRLVLAGPIEVRKEILEAQNQWMIGHRGKAFEVLYASLQAKLKQIFFTENSIYAIATSGTGFWEAAVRNCVRDDKKVLHFTSGAFSERWAVISKANGKQVDIVTAEWGQAITPEMVADALSKDTYDAVCIVHNETSTTVTNPIKDISDIVRQCDDTLFMVDTVSGLAGIEFYTDDWGVDVALTSSQKAFALPPGIAFCAVSERARQRADAVPYRGYYFDFLSLEKSHQKNSTPSTPPVSLMYAADKQLTDILDEGIENRWARHIKLRDMTHEWAANNGFGLFAADGYNSPTITAIDNREVGIDVNAMAAFMADRGFSMDKGYGKIKGDTFRIGHMGDMSLDFLQEVLDGLSEFVTVKA